MSSWYNFSVYLFGNLKVVVNLEFDGDMPMISSFENEHGDDLDFTKFPLSEKEISDYVYKNYEQTMFDLVNDRLDDLRNEDRR